MCVCVCVCVCVWGDQYIIQHSSPLHIIMFLLRTISLSIYVRTLYLNDLRERPTFERSDINLGTGRYNMHLFVGSRPELIIHQFSPIILSQISTLLFLHCQPIIQNIHTCISDIMRVISCAWVNASAVHPCAINYAPVRSARLVAITRRSRKIVPVVRLGWQAGHALRLPWPCFRTDR